MNKKTKELEIIVGRANWGKAIEFLIYSGNSVVKDLTFYEQEPFTQDTPAAQKFIDSLWGSGLRPSEGSGSVGALKAVQDHLADMREIAFNRLKINIKGPQ
ncbi:hypothetical protein LCGC14_2301860 [marine sediment metagenome]|uniref:Uncharacterized protein n=1 Tax=marine sediment metagenome TaxID=412755 RepID=A0A0F9DAS0_9ZZZZ